MNDELNSKEYYQSGLEKIELIETLDALKSRYGKNEVLDVLGPMVVTPKLLVHVARTARKSGLALVKRTCNLTSQGIERLNDCLENKVMMEGQAPGAFKELLAILPQNPVDIVDGRIVTSEPSVYSLQIDVLNQALDSLHKELEWVNLELEEYDTKNQLFRWALKNTFKHDLALRTTIMRRIGKLDLLKSHYSTLADIENEHDKVRVNSTRELAMELIHNTKLGKNLSGEPELDAVLELHNQAFSERKAE
jgi:hypothetical protein